MGNNTRRDSSSLLNVRGWRRPVEDMGSLTIEGGGGGGGGDGGGGGEEEEKKKKTKKRGKEKKKLFSLNLGLFLSVTIPPMLHIHWPVIRRMISRNSTEKMVPLLHITTTLNTDITRVEKRHNLFLLTYFSQIHISLSTFSKASCGLTFCFNGNLRKSQANQPTWNQHTDLECMELRTHTPWSKVLLEKLTGIHLIKKFLASCGTRRFITALTSARHLSLS